jgi:hypothetical protein
MTPGNGRIVRILAATAAAAVVAVSCPNPIDRDLLLVVNDKIDPILSISTPSASSYYHGTIHVSGFLLDSSDTAGDRSGRLHTLTFSVSNNSLLSRTITFNDDGTFTVEPSDPSFTWDSTTGSFALDCQMADLQGYQVLSFVASDANGNQARSDVGLMPYPYGPHLLSVEIEGLATNSSSDGNTDEIKALEWEGAGDSGEIVLNTATWVAARNRYESDSFWYDPVTSTFHDVLDTSRKKDPISLKVGAQNRSLMWSYVTVVLMYPGTGPAITILSYPGEYSSDVTHTITVTGRVEDMAILDPDSMLWKAQHPPEDPQMGVISAPDVSGIFSFTFDPVGDDPPLSGDLSIEVSALDSHGVETRKYLTCLDDPYPPDPPTFTGPSSPTNDATPTWTWNTPAETVGFRYVLDNASPDEDDWTVWAGTSWTAPTFGNNTTHTLSVQGRDALGNWSVSASSTLTIDLTAPDPPNVTGVNETQDHRPPWSWTTPEYTVQFRHCLNPDLMADPSTWSWTYTVDQYTTSWTPGGDLSHGTYILYVQGRDEAGNWSLYGSHGVEIKEE